MKSDFLKKIIAATVISTTMATVLPINAAAIDFYTWQQMNSQSGGYWRQYGGSWYFYDYLGILQTGWIYDKGQWYYADANGVMQTGVVQVNGKIYLFSNSGAMQTGNAVINGQYYTFDQNGVATGSNIPTPAKAYGVSGESTVAYTPDQVVKDDDSSPTSPNTVARDPQNLIKYNVKFKDDDGDELRTTSVEKDDKITLYTPTKSGYKFVEWNTKKDGDGKSYDGGDALTVTKDISLYAQWEVSSSTDDSSSDSDSTDTVLVESITVTSTSSTIATKGGTLQMTANALPVDATNRNVTWSIQSGSSGTATISSTGLLTASGNGDVIVVATANDGSNILGKATITISGQNTSTSTDTGGSTSNGGSTTGGSTTGGTTTTTVGKITVFEQNVVLDDVTLSTDAHIVDIPLLKASGKLPTKAAVPCILSSGTSQKVEIPIKDWTGTFDKAKGTYNLVAVLGDLPTGYTIASGSTTTLPSPKIKVIVDVAQTDERKNIVGDVNLGEFTLGSNKNITNITLLNSAEILPKTVQLSIEGSTDKVTANIKAWKLAASGAVFNYTAGGSNSLIADIEVPAGYILGSSVKVTATLTVTSTQTSVIQEIVGVVKNADRTIPSGGSAVAPHDGKELKLNYTQNDLLELDNLMVEVKYNDGSLGYILYKDFAANKIETKYIDKMQLKDITNFLIPVTFNSKTVYSEKVTVGAIAAPTVKAQDVTKIIYNSTDTTKNDNIVFNYTLGTGSKAASGISKVSIGGVALTKDTDYTDDGTKTLTITTTGLAKYVSPATPATVPLNVEFTLSGGTSTIKPDTTPVIYFVSTPTTTPATITLAQDGNVPDQNNKIKLLNLVPSTPYEYCVIDPTYVGATPDTSTWTKFTPTLSDGTIELYDSRFAAGMNLYLRIQSKKIGEAVNPASKETPAHIILSNEIGKTKSSENTITSFDLKSGSTVFKGTVTQPTLTGGKGKISVVVPNETDVTSLIANYVLSQTDPAKVTVTVGSTTQVSGTTTNDFTNLLEYTVKAENGATKVYEVEVVKPNLQNTVTRPDTMEKGVTVSVTDSSGTTTTTKTVAVDFTSEYTDAGLAINPIAGQVTITVPSSYIKDSNPSKALSNIMNGTLYTRDTDKQTAYVGMKFNAYTGATSVKVAENLEDLKNGKNVTTVQLSSSGINTLGGQYLEQIPVAKYGTVSAGVWEKVTSSTTKYYAWIDSNGNVLGYTSLIIKVV